MFIVVVHGLTYFVKHEAKGRKCYAENEVVSMLELSITYLSSSKGTSCSPFLADLFLYAYET